MYSKNVIFKVLDGSNGDDGDSGNGGGSGEG